jgi:ABC-type proline/glycine betaine transport system permease subunit
MSTLRPPLPHNHDNAFRNWVVLTTVGLLLAFTALFWALTGSLVAALGIAGFAAVWGGVGFGVMAAGAAQALRDDRAARMGK